MNAKDPKGSVRASIQMILLSAVLLVSLVLGQPAPARAQGEVADLFGDASEVSSLYDAGNEPFVVRSRIVSLNIGLLVNEKGVAYAADANPVVGLNIFPDAKYTGMINQVKREGDTTNWTGSLAEVDGGYFYMTKVGDAFIAHVASTDGVYEVSSVGDGFYRAIQIDQSQLIDDYPGEYDEPGPVYQDVDLSGLTDSGSIIDIMVVYTPAALAGEGGSTAAMKARIALAVAEANTSYANAGVTSRLRLVHTEKITYTETGNISTDVNRLAATGDGYMDSVHSLRNTYGADMVSLVVENGGGYCGIAKTIMATATSAFDVVVRNGCMTGY